MSAEQECEEGCQGMVGSFGNGGPAHSSTGNSSTPVTFQNILRCFGGHSGHTIGWNIDPSSVWSQAKGSILGISKNFLDICG